MKNAPRTLVLMRHAKAESYAESDRERGLTPAGDADAVEAGEWLAAQGVELDRALVSTAARTRATWSAVSQGSGLTCEVEYDESLYDAGPETVLDLVRLADDDVETLLVIGHNPTIGYLAQLLADPGGDGEAFDQMAAGFPACAVAVMEFDGPWAELEMGTARVAAFHVGRG